MKKYSTKLRTKPRNRRGSCISTSISLWYIPFFSIYVSSTVLFASSINQWVVVCPFSIDNVFLHLSVCLWNVLKGLGTCVFLLIAAMSVIFPGMSERLSHCIWSGQLYSWSRGTCVSRNIIWYKVLSEISQVVRFVRKPVYFVWL